jgi:hypothetical protein
MKKYIFLLFLLLFTKVAFAPSYVSLPVIDSAPVRPFDKLIYAIGMAETKLDTLAYNPVEKAVGYFQIRPIRLRDYNQRTGSNLKLKEMYEYEKAEKVFMYYALKIGPYDFEKIARNWNGSGRKTATYWKRVKQYI